MHQWDDRRLAQAALGVLAGLTLGLAAVPAWAGTALEDLAAAMQPGTWAQLTTTGISTLSMPNGGTIIEYSDEASWDPVSRRLFILGASHHGTFEDKFVAYEENSNSWVTLTDPYPGTSVVHTYDHQAIDPAAGMFYFRRYYSGEVGQYNMRTDIWSTLPILPLSYTWCCSALEHFPELGGLVLSHGDEVYTFSSNRWAQIGTVPIASGISNFSEYSPTHRVLMFGGGDNEYNLLYKLNSSGTITRMKDSPVALGMTYSVFTLDPVSGNFLVLSNSGAFYEYNPSTDAWKLLANTTPPFTAASTFTIVASPISNYGVTMFVAWNFNNSQVFLYKHASGTLPSWVPVPGTFANIALNFAKDVDPCPGHNCVYSEVTGQEAVFVVWNGGAFATDYSPYGALLVHGGGHNAYSGNEVYAFDLSTRMWSRVGMPSLYKESQIDNNGEYPDGQPFPPHTFEGVEYLSTANGGGPKGSFLRFGFAGAGINQWVHRMPLDTGPNTQGAWRRFSNLPFTQSYFATAYDPTRKLYWVIGTLNSWQNGFGSVTPSGQATLFPNQGDNIGGDHVLEYLPTFDMLVHYADCCSATNGPTLSGKLLSGSAAFSKLNTTGPLPPDADAGHEW